MNPGKSCFEQTCSPNNSVNCENSCKIPPSCNVPCSDECGNNSCKENCDGECGNNCCNEHCCKCCDNCRKERCCGECCEDCCREHCRDECENRQCISDIIESVALVETALAHILNAEGEKIQRAVRISGNINDLLEVNRSVNKTIMNVIQLEQINYQKLDAIAEICRTECDMLCRPGGTCPSPEPDPCGTCPCPEPDPCGTCPCPEQEPVKPCCQDCSCQGCKPCVTVFSAAAAYPWSCGTAMNFRQETYCGKKEILCCENNCPYILLPAGKKYKIEYEIDLYNNCSESVSVDMNMCYKNSVIKAKNIFVRDNNCRLTSCGDFICETPCGCEKSNLSIWLLSASNIKINNCKIKITEM